MMSKNKPRHNPDKNKIKWATSASIMKNMLVVMYHVKEILAMRKYVRGIHIIVLRHFTGDQPVGVISRLIMAISRDKWRKYYGI